MADRTTNRRPSISESPAGTVNTPRTKSDVLLTGTSMAPHRPNHPSNRSSLDSVMGIYHFAKT